jgi:hypothetical protein
MAWDEVAAAGTAATYQVLVTHQVVVLLDLTWAG